MTLTTKILLCLLLLKYYCVYYYLNIIVFTVIKILLCLLLIKYLCVYCYYNYFAMPRPRRSNISKRSRNAMRHRNNETQYTADEREIARELRRVSMGRLRVLQTQEQREAARQTHRLEMRNRRAQQRDNLHRARRNDAIVDLHRVAFQYDCTFDYSLHPSVQIGRMEVLCDYCGALKFTGETSAT